MFFQSYQGSILTCFLRHPVLSSHSFQSYQGSILTLSHREERRVNLHFQSYQGSILTLIPDICEGYHQLSILSRFNFNRIKHKDIPGLRDFQSYQGSILTALHTAPSRCRPSFNPIKVQF